MPLLVAPPAPMAIHAPAAPLALATPRVRVDWPGTADPAAVAARAAKRDADIAHQFEILIAETLLKSARAARLGDDSPAEGGLVSGRDDINAMIDHQRAEAIARAAPIGVARLLAAERAPK